MDSDAAISISGLVKRFGHARALDGLDLEVAQRRGARVPRPERLRQVDDDPRAARPAARRRGHGARCSAATRGATPSRCTGGSPTCPATSRLWPNLTGGEAIDLLGRAARRARPRAARRAASSASSSTRPRGRARTRRATGRRSRSSPRSPSDAELLILDEPTSGLDPLMEAVFQDCVREVRDAGRTVLLSSHILAEVEALCDRVSIIRAGRTVETGTLAELRHLTRTSIDRRDGRAPCTGSTRSRACTTCASTAAARASRSTPRSSTTRSQLLGARRRAQPGEPAADARGAVPPPLRRRARPDGRRVTGAGALAAAQRCGATGSDAPAVGRSALGALVAAHRRRAPGALPDAGRPGRSSAASVDRQRGAHRAHGPARALDTARRRARVPARRFARGRSSR